MQSQSVAQLRRHLILLSGTRTITNTAYRMVFPFLPAFARGLGVELEALALAITVRQALGVTAPILGSAADVLGRKTSMLVGLGLFIGGFIFVGVLPTYTTVFIALILSGIGKSITDPAIIAYLGDRIHSSQHGLVVAISEFSWSAAFLIGVPLVGLIIARSDWTTPFPVLAVLAIIASLVIFRIVPADYGQTLQPSLARSFQTVLKRPSAVAVLVIGLFLGAGNASITIIYGAWLEDAFGLQVAALGAATAVIGFAELSGEGLVAALADRMSRRGAILLGIGLNVPVALLLPAFGGDLTVALLALAAFFISYEFGIVSTIALMVELVPDARATMLAGRTATQRGGFALGTLLGPWLFKYGIRANTYATVTLDLLAITALVLFVKEARRR